MVIQKNDTGHFCDKKQTNQSIDMKFEIHTIQPIIYTNHIYFAISRDTIIEKIGNSH